MRKRIFLLTILSLIIYSTNGQENHRTVFMFIPDNNDTVVVACDEILKIDTVNNTVELTKDVTEKLSLQTFSYGKVLTVRNGNLMNVYLVDCLSSQHLGYPKILLVKNRLPFSGNVITIYGMDWRQIKSLCSMSL